MKIAYLHDRRRSSCFGIALSGLLLSLQAWAAAPAAGPVATLVQASGVQCTDATAGTGCTAGDVASGDFHDVELTPGCGAQGQRVCVQAIGRAGRNPPFYFVTSVPASSVAACKAGSALCGTYGDRPIQHLKRAATLANRHRHSAHRAG